MKSFKWSVLSLALTKTKPLYWSMVLSCRLRRMSRLLIEPNCRDYMIFAHRSEESGHKILLELLDAEPLLDLGLRLGEGTGAALAMPIIRAAAEFYNNMASFESAGVTV